MEKDIICSKLLRALAHILSLIFSWSHHNWVAGPRFKLRSMTRKHMHFLLVSLVLRSAWEVEQTMNSIPSQWIFSLNLPFGLQYDLIMQPRAQGRVSKTGYSLFKITYSVERVSGQDGTSASYQGSLFLVDLPFYPQMSTLSWFLPFSGCYHHPEIPERPLPL